MIFETQPPSKRIVNRLIALRVAKNKTQKNVADFLGTDSSRVSYLERNYDTEIRIIHIQAYAAALGLELELTVNKDGEMDLATASFNKRKKRKCNQ